MLKKVGFFMLTGAVMAALSPVYIHAEESTPKKEMTQDAKKDKKKKKGGCPCGK